jgi:hypothetical protein
MIGYLALYVCAGCFVLLVMRFRALEPGTRSFRTLVYRPGFFELNERDTPWERVLLVSVFMALMFFWPVLVLIKIYIAFQKPTELNLVVPKSVYIEPTDALVRPVSVEEAEEEGQIQDPLGRVPNLAFGFFHDAWRKFLAEKQADDELWTFTIQQDENRSNFSCKQVSGFRLLRDGAIVGEFIAESN